jgi:hypothetical protein
MMTFLKISIFLAVLATVLMVVTIFEADRDKENRQPTAVIENHDTQHMSGQQPYASPL